MEPRRILFATVPADGHFNPLTGMAKHLQSLGHDVRWYAGPSYEERLRRLGIPHLPFQSAVEVTASRLNEHFPERQHLKGLKLIRFEFKHVVVGPMASNFTDIAAIAAHEFPFDVLVADAMFYAYALVARVLHKPVFVVNVAPMMFSSGGETPPNFTGLTPAKTAAGRFVHRHLRTFMEKISMSEGMPVYEKAFTDQGVEPPRGSIFDLPLSCATGILQSGVPGFAYPRRRLDPKVVFAGPLLPYALPVGSAASTPVVEPGGKIVVISQGTVDNGDPTKLIVPAVEALRGRGHQLYVATGGANTEQLRRAYAADDTVIEDFLDFRALFHHADLFVCNGGYGSILLALSNGVPVLSAGVREGKNDVNAHVRYFGVGTDLRTERPKPGKIRTAAERLLADGGARARAAALAAEMHSYDANAIVARVLFGPSHPTPSTTTAADRNP